MKKLISVLVLTAMVAAFLCTPAMAAESDVKKGFGVTGETENATVTALASDGEVIEKTVDLDGVAEDTEDILYINSDQLNVEYTAAAAGGYYGIILVDGDGTTLPTKDNAVFYIDQLTASSSIISYNVKPIIPTTYDNYTLYISTNVAGKSLVKIPLRYDGYIVGDINKDGMWNSTDALITLQIGGNLYDATGLEELAGDVTEDGIWNSTDALRILQYGGNLIDSWD